MDPTIQQEQTKLKAMGLYDGPIDGRDGPATQTARAKFEAQGRADAQSQQAAQLQRQQFEAQKMQADAQRAETARQQALADRQAQEKAAGETPYEQGRQIAINAVPGIGGLYLGKKAADLLDERFQNAAGYRAEQLRNLADASNTLDPRAVAKTADRLNLAQTRRGGLASYMVPLTFGATGGAARFYGADQVNNEIGSDVLRALGSAEMGAGAGALGQMLLQDVSSTPRINAVDLAKIEQARLGAKSPGPSPITTLPMSQSSARPSPPAAAADLVPGSKAHLVEQAKSFGIKGASAMSKGDLATALITAVQEHGGRRTIAQKAGDLMSKASGKGIAALPPVLAGTMAYDSMMHPADAADGTQREPNRLAAALTAGGVGGATYGGMKALDMLGKAAPMTMRTLGGGFAAASPASTIDALTDIPSSDLEDMRRWSARNLPGWMTSGEIAAAGDREALEQAAYKLPKPGFPIR